MSTLLRPAGLTTLASLLRLLVKHGRAGLFEGVDTPVSPGSGRPEELADDLEAMGPTWVKLGQLLSTRPDLVPEPYLKGLRRLRDRVEPFPVDVARRIIEEELGVRVGKAFSVFEDEPVAAASLAQVHRARLRDGRPVAVKVQRPDAPAAVERDLEILAEVARIVEERTEAGRRLGARDLFSEIDRSLRAELDFRGEARNLDLLSAGLADYPHLTVPAPVHDYTGVRVLTMELVEGTSVGSLGPMARMELEAGPLLDDLIAGYLHLALIDGLVHADPHPGNVMVTRDGRLALLDAGMVLRVPEHLRDPLLQLLVALSTGQGREAARVMESMSHRSVGYDRRPLLEGVARLVAEHHDEPPRQRSVGRLVLAAARAAAQAGVKPPRETSLLGKTLLNLDETSRCLDPDFAPDPVVRREAAGLVQKRSLATLAPEHALRALLETREFVTELPDRLNRALDVLGRGRVEVDVRIPDDSPVMRGSQKMANRITAGLVIASLIVGAALLMSVPTDFEILGYPGLAMLFFLAAAIGGATLVARIWKDV